MFTIVQSDNNNNNANNKSGNANNANTNADNDELEAFINHIPDRFKNNATGEKKNAKKTFRKIADKSNFLITINPNISFKTLPDNATKKAVAKKLLSAGKHIRAKLSNGIFCKPKGMRTPDYKHPALIKYKKELEMGGKKGFIHMHIIASFDGVCHIDLSKLRDYVRGHFGRNVHLQVKYFQNTQTAMEAYIEKTKDDDNENVGQIRPHRIRPKDVSGNANKDNKTEEKIPMGEFLAVQV